MHRLLASSLSLSLFLFLYYLYATALSSQAARASETHYRALHQGNLYLAIWYLLDHSDGTVKAKTCNLVGNLCRHSGFFYKTLVTPLTDLSPGLYNHSTGARGGGGGGAKGAAGAAGANEPPTILRRLIVRCGDEDRATRKFACFAVGNAAFHSAVLYPHLAAAVPPLVDAMLDREDEKTRANAAGALGNLVRNSSELCGALLEHGVLRRLLEVATDDPAAGPKRIALFSLGTISVYARCRPSLEALEPPLAATLAGLEQRHAADKQMVDHIQRIRNKMAQPSIA